MSETPPSLAVSLAPAFDLLLDAVCMVDGQGVFVHVSAAAQQIFGYAPEELIGRRMIDLVLPEDRERTLQAAQRVMALVQGLRADDVVLCLISGGGSASINKGVYHE